MKENKDSKRQLFKETTNCNDLAEDLMKDDKHTIFKCILNSISGIVHIADPKTYEILYVNKTMHHLFQKDLLGGICYREIKGLQSPCAFCRSEMFFKEKDNCHQWEYYNPSLKRDFMIVDKIVKWSDGRDVCFEYAVDITALKRAGEELEEARKKDARIERMASLGTMAAGIAHEINQPLNSIKIIVEGMLYLNEKGKYFAFKEVLVRLKEISAQVDRIADIIKNMDSLEGDKSFSSTPTVNLNDAVNGALRLLENRLFSHGIKIRRSLEKFLPLIQGDRGKMEEALANLIINAMQALESVDKGEKMVFVSTRAEKNIVLEMRDNATGIRAEYMDKIFDPFFTTKEVGSGMGLGLSIVHAIVTACNGTIHVANNDDGGATFRLEFPYVKN